MKRFLVKRITALVCMLFAVSVATFLLPYVTGSDPTAAILRSRIPDAAPTPDLLAGIRQELGLDESLVTQYRVWLGNALQGDLGYSYVSREPIGPMLADALLVSVIIAVAALGLAIAVSIPLGILAALRPGKWLDNAITGVTQTGVAVPEFWLGPMLILVFSLWLRWLPSAGWRGSAFLVLPAVTLAIRPIAYFTRLMRASMIEVLASQYIVAAQARGLTYRQAVVRHGLRNALMPVATLFTLWFAALLGGSIVVEVIFAIPGMGRLLYQSIINSDLPVTQAGLLMIVGLTVTIATLTDLLYTILNPAIRVDQP